MDENFLAVKQSSRFVSKKQFIYIESKIHKAMLMPEEFFTALESLGVKDRELIDIVLERMLDDAL